MTRTIHAAAVALIVLTVLIAGAARGRAAERPSFLVILADDCTYNDLPVYGGRNARTPNIDRLAAEGLTFDRAYLSEAMCQPCRAELYTGLYPMRNGCAWNHSASRPAVKSLPHHLRPLDYRTGLAGKVHVKPGKAFPFERVGGFDGNCVRDPTRPHDVKSIREFMSGGSSGDGASQPFCLVVALVEPHVPWVMGDASKYPPDKIELPPNIADTPRTREAFSHYLAEITFMDGQVGDILAALEASGRADETLVMFSSEQGSQFPGCKWTNWDTGLHTALLARWPGKVAAGRRTDAIVQYADVLPTLVHAAGGEVAKEKFDGSSFLAVLLGKATRHRQYAYGIHNNVPEGPPYPIRSITDGTYRYIRNLRPENIYIEKHLMGSAGGGKLSKLYWATWVREAWADEKTYGLVKRYLHRPAEQLYHTDADPYELIDLSRRAALEDKKARLSAELARWMKAQGDPGAEQDTRKALAAARRGRHLYGVR